MVVFHKWGDKHKKVIVLIHGWGCPWKIWKPYTEEFQKEHYVIVPSLSGYNEGKKEKAAGVAENAREISNYLKEQNIKVHCIVGISFGASVALKILALIYNA